MKNIIKATNVFSKMAQEFSCGTIVFRKDTEPIYLLLNYSKGHWDFPKGHVEKGESAHETAIRETMEETGIGDLQFVDGFREKIEYFFRQNGKLVHKEVTYFLAETQVSEVKLSFEHKSFAWLSFEEALSKTTFKNSKEILIKAHKFLKEAK